MVHVRPSRSEDSEGLRVIERQAGERFRTVGLDAVADAEPASVAELSAYAAGERSWVALADGAGDEVGDDLIGYVLVDVVDGLAHVEQISVRPDHQGQGVGRALLDQVRAWADRTGRRAITLTTFVDVAWNRPLYEHLGFRVLADDEIGPELAWIRGDEAGSGLDPTQRVGIRLDLADPA